MFVLTISCFTMSDFPWFMDLTFQVPIQYCSLQYQILLSSPDTCITECHFHFGPAASFFLGLLVVLLHSSPVAYWTPSDLGDSFFGVISFCSFIRFMRFNVCSFLSLHVWNLESQLLFFGWIIFLRVAISWGCSPKCPSLKGNFLVTLSLALNHGIQSCE